MDITSDRPINKVSFLFSSMTIVKFGRKFRLWMFWLEKKRCLWRTSYVYALSRLCLILMWSHHLDNFVESYLWTLYFIFFHNRPLILENILLLKAMYFDKSHFREMISLPASWSPDIQSISRYLLLSFHV